MEKDKQRYSDLLSLLIKNLPPVIASSNDKGGAYEIENRFTPTIKALMEKRYIQFNSKAQISFLIFDMDKVGHQTALQHFGSLEVFVHHVYAEIGLIPTFCTQTDKGFHFGFHLKNHIFTRQKNVKEYAKSIKRAISEKFGCDKIASHKLYGIWRNPLQHKYFYSGVTDYELASFKHLLPKRKKRATTTQNSNKKGQWSMDVKSYQLDIGNRNNRLFMACITFADYHKANLTLEALQNYLSSQNQKAHVPLKDVEIKSICKYVYDKHLQDELYIVPKEYKDIENRGAMEFLTIRNLPYDKYLIEVKKRQSLSAKRTNEMKSQKTINQSLKKARAKRAENLKEKNIIKISKALELLQGEEKKITISAISKIAKLSRATVSKYYQKSI